MKTHKVPVTLIRVRALAGALFALTIAASLPAQLTSSGSSDGAAGDSRIVVPASGNTAITLTNSATYVYTNFAATTPGGVAFASSGATLTFAADPDSLFMFTNNTTTGATGAGGGGAIYADTTSNLTIQNAIFMNNQALYGGAIATGSSTVITVNLTNVSFLNNIATAGVASGFVGGGAIWMCVGTLNLNVTAGNTAVFAGNTAGGVSNGIHFANNGGTPKLNVNIDDGASLDMLDPMSSMLGNQTTTFLTITQTGGGVWNLGGASVLNGNATANGSAQFNVTSGTLHLYRVNESALGPDGNTYKSAAGSLSLTPAVTGATKSIFTLGTAAGAPATLSIGGGNSITSNGSINLLAGSILAYDIAGAAKEGLSSATSLLTLNAMTSYNILTGGVLNSTINFESWAAGSFNLLTAGTQLTTALDPTAFNYTYDGGALDTSLWSMTPTIQGNSLWVQFAYIGSISANALTWVGNSTEWFDAGNWSSAGSPATFGPGDVVNFDGSNTDNNPNTVHLDAPVTTAGMYMSGNQTYKITGAGITGDNTPVTGAAAVTGKLILGGNAPDVTKSVDTTAASAFTGVLDFTGQDAGVVNNFTGGVDIYSGGLRVATAGQIGATLSQVNFYGTPAATGTLIIAGAAMFDSAGASLNRFSVMSGMGAAIAIENGASATFTSNTAGAITFGDNASLTLAADGNGSYQFTNNTSTGNGAAINGAGASSTISLANANFDHNTANNGNGGAIDQTAVSSVYTITSATFSNNNAVATTANTAGAGGAVASTAQSNTFSFSGVLFSSNTSKPMPTTTNYGGGAIFNSANLVTITINSSTLDNNAAITASDTRAGGGALYNNGNGVTVNIDRSLFENNYTSGAGGAIELQNNTANGGVNPTLTISNALFLSNSAVMNGGAINVNQSAVVQSTYTDVSFINNHSDANGGAITENSGTMNFNVATSATFAGNTAGVDATLAPNSIYFTGASPLLNINISNPGDPADTTPHLDMLDPIASANTATMIITQTGAGTWNLGGANTSTGAVNFTVAQGTLHLYRDKELTTATYGHDSTAGSLNYTAAGSTFTLSSGATLSIGGGNAITTAGAINLNAGSILAFDIAGYDPISAAPMLSLTAATLNLTSDPTTFNFGLNLLNLTDSGSYNLLAANFSSISGFTPDSTTLAFFGGDPAGLGSFTYTTGITDNILWIDLVGATALDRPGAPDENHILDWNGAGGSWSGANWTIGDTTGYAFLAGDLINLTGSDAPEGVTNATVNLSDTGTLAGLYVSGSLSIALKGPGLVADAASTNYTIDPAAAGKLILGGYYDELEYLTFTGTLDLSGLTSNSFAGIEINTGALRVSTNDNLGIATLNQLTFTGADGALIIANGGNVAFDDSVAGAASANQLLIGGTDAITGNLAVTSATIIAEPGATFSIAHSAATGAWAASSADGYTWSGSDGGAISIAPSSTLVLSGTLAGAGGGFLFDSNTAVNRGGAIYSNTVATLIIDSATFTNNISASGGGAIAVNSGTLVVRDSVFKNNTALGSGNNGGAALNIANASNYLEVTNVLFDSNTSTVGNGGAIFFPNTSTAIFTSVTFANNFSGNIGGGLDVNGNNNTVTLNNVVFQGNSAVTGGGGLAMAGNTSTVTLNNADFVGNTATGQGGAIYFGQSVTLNYNVTAGNTSLVAGNYDNITTSGSRANAISLLNTGTATININVQPGATLNMLDPIANAPVSTAAQNTGMIVSFDGGGLWNLGGSGSFFSQQNGTPSTNNANSAMMTFSVNSGTLHLYRDNEATYTYNGQNYTTTAANLSLGTSVTLAARQSKFTLGSASTSAANPAVLSIGGGNTIAASGAITLADNSTLAFDLGGFFADPANSAATMLTLTGGSLTATWANLNLNLLGLDLLSTDANATYNLLTVNKNLFTNTTFANDPLAPYADLADGYTLKLSGDKTTLQLIYAIPGQYTNTVLAWAGSTAADGSSWSGATNWLALDPDTLTRTGTNTNPGDILNLADETVTPAAITPAIPAPATTTLDVDTTTTATIAGMNLSGTTNYTITGAAIAALPAIGTLADQPAANGKLTLGAIAPDDASAILTDADDPTVAYTGTLTLANDSDTFAAGIDILSGELVGAAANLAVGPAAGILDNGALTFDQPTDDTYAAVISGNGTLNKTGTGALTLTAANTLTGLTTINAGSLLLGSAASLAGDITVNADATLGGVGTAGANVAVATGGSLMAGLTHGDHNVTAPEILAINGDLSLDTGANLLLDLYDNNQSDRITVVGAATVAGPVTVEISSANSGTYTLLTAATLAALDTDFTAALTGGATLSDRSHTLFDLATTPNTLLLEIVNSNTTLTWTAADTTQGLVWTTAGTNWASPVGADTFLKGDSVTFDDSVTADKQTIAIPGAVTAADMTVHTDATYAFTGPGSITTSADPADTNLAEATGKLTKTGAGLLDFTALTGSNNFTTGIDLIAGSIIGSAATLGTPIVTTQADTTLTIAQATDADYAAAITGAGNFAKTLAGNLTLTGLTDYTGNTTLSAGALTLTTAGQIQSSATVTIDSGATLNTGANPQTLNHLNGAGNIATTAGGALLLNNTTADTTLSGIISGAASITKDGARALTLAGDNTLTGDLNIAAGALNLTGANNTAAGAVIAATGTLGLGAGSAAGTLSGAITNDGVLILNHGAVPITLANTLSGAGLIDKVDTGLLTLTAANTFTGTTNIATGGGLVIAPNASLLGQINLSANTTLAGAGTLGNVTTLGSATITIGDLASATPQTLATGTLTLAGPTTLNYDLFASGTGDLLSAAALNRAGSDTISIAVNSSLSGTYTLIATTAALATTATDNLALLIGGAAPVAGGRTEYDFLATTNNLDLIVVTHNLAILWAGSPANTWKDTGSNWNTNNGNDGTFHNGDAVTFADTGAGAVAIDPAGVQTVGMTVNATAGSYTFTGGAITTSATINSTIFTTTDSAAATGLLTLAATNKALVTLSNTGNNFEAGIIINGGTLQGNAANLTVGTGAGIANNSALVFDQATAATYTTPITGAGLLVKQAAGALTLDNTANTYTGGINVLAGSLILANPAAAIGAVNISTAATLDLTNPASIGAAAVNGTLKITDNAAFTLANAVTGSGLLDITTGAGNAIGLGGVSATAFTGTVALGASTYTLGTNLAAATLVLNAGNVTTIGSTPVTVGNLDINGALLDFATTVPADTAAPGLITTNKLTLGATGTIQVNIPGATPAAPAPAGAQASLFAQSATTIDALITATGGVTGNANGYKLLAQNGTDLTATAQTADIVQTGNTVATGTYNYFLDANGGLNVKYGLTALTIANGSTLTLQPAAGETGTFGATISGNNATLDIAGATPVTLGKTNDFAGAINVAANSALIAGANGSLGAASNTLTLAAASTFDLNGKTQTLGAVTTASTSTLNLNSGALTLQQGGHIAGALAGAAASALAINGGNLAIDAANANFAGATTIAAGATATLGNTAALGSAPITDNGALTLNNAADGALANAITGAGALNFNGPGAVAIDHDNTLTGPVAVNNGTVTAATTAALGSGDIAIGSAGALAYNAAGALNNAITANGALTLNPGAGALVVNSNVTGAGTMNLAGAIELTGANTIANIVANTGASINANNTKALNSTNLTMNDATVTLMQPGATLGNLTMNGASTLGYAKGLTPGATLNVNSIKSNSAGATFSLNTNIGAGTSDFINLATTDNSGLFGLELNNTGTAPNVTGTNAIPSLQFVDAAKLGAAARIVGSGSFQVDGSKNYIVFNADTDNDSSINFEKGGLTGGAQNAIAAATGAMPLTWLTELDTLGKRLGDLQIDPREKPGMDLWARAYAQRINVNDKDSPVPFHETQYGTEVGIDYGGRPTGYGAATYVGAFVGYGGSSRDVNNINGSGNMNSVYGGLYATFITPDGWYLDLVGKYNHFKSTFTADTDNGSFSNDAFGASVEAGKRIELGGNWSVTPNAQASIVRVFGQDYTMNGGGSKVSLEQTTSRQVRAGAQAAYKIVTKAGQIWQPYAKAYLAQQWTDGGQVRQDTNDPDTLAIKGTRVDLGLGVNWQILKSLQVYFDYECSFAKDYTKPYGLTLGANYAW